MDPILFLLHDFWENKDTLKASFFLGTKANKETWEVALEVEGGVYFADALHAVFFVFVITDFMRCFPTIGEDSAEIRQRNMVDFFRQSKWHAKLKAELNPMEELYDQSKKQGTATRKSIQYPTSTIYQVRIFCLYTGNCKTWPEIELFRVLLVH